MLHHEFPVTSRPIVALDRLPYLRRACPRLSLLHWLRSKRLCVASTLCANLDCWHYLGIRNTDELWVRVLSSHREVGHVRLYTWSKIAVYSVERCRTHYHGRFHQTEEFPVPLGRTRILLACLCTLSWMQQCFTLLRYSFKQI